MPLLSSYKNPEDELEESAPYSSISDRPPLEDVNPLPMDSGANPPPSGPDPTVMNFIANRTMKPTGLDADPLMQQYAQDQQALEAQRQQKAKTDLVTNVGASLDQIALGASAPMRNRVYENIAKQNQEGLQSKEQDVERRRRVMDAIENRKSREQLTHLRQQEIDKNMQLRREDRIERESKLSEKQASQVQEFDDSLNTMRSLVNQLGDKSGWTGPVDGRVPDFLVGKDEVAFRAELGRMVDQYRKLITGAGASNQELKRLESRLPSATDTHDNFVAKAKNFIQTVERNKGSFLSNLSKQGKNVAAFQEAPSSRESSGGKTVVKKQFSPSRNQTKLIFSDGSEEIVDGQQ